MEGDHVLRSGNLRLNKDKAPFEQNRFLFKGFLLCIIVEEDDYVFLY